MGHRVNVSHDLEIEAQMERNEKVFFWVIPHTI